MSKTEVRERRVRWASQRRQAGESGNMLRPDGHYADSYRELRKMPPFVRPHCHENGEPWLRMMAFHRFTIGQRRGLGFATGQPMFVS